MRNCVCAFRNIRKMVVSFIFEGAKTEEGSVKITPESVTDYNEMVLIYRQSVIRVVPERIYARHC